MNAEARRALIDAPITITQHASGQSWAGASKAIALPQAGRRVRPKRFSDDIEIDEWQIQLYGGDRA